MSKELATTPIPTPTIDIAVLRSDTDYMAGCLELNSDVYRSQANYKGIYPGRTRDSEVRHLVGEPLKINNLTDISWEYKGFAIIFEKTLVTWVVAYNDEILNNTLEDVIHKYGCPDAISTLDINEHPYGEYSRLLFIYHNIGFDFTIDKVPAELSDGVNATYYYGPMTLEEYIDKFDLLNPNASKPIAWDDAVR